MKTQFTSEKVDLIKNENTTIIELGYGKVTFENVTDILVTEEQLKDTFRKFIEVTRRDLLKQKSILKITIPENLRDNWRLKSFPKQVSSTPQEVVKTSNSGVYFTKPARYKHKHIYPEFNPANISEVETVYNDKQFWEEIERKKVFLYASDVPYSLMNDDIHGTWNLRNLPNLLKDVLPSEIPGITSSYIYCGLPGSHFSLHTEDYELCSLSYLHAGASKIWYAFYPEDFIAIREFCKKLYKEDFDRCGSFNRHKNILISPFVLSQAGFRIIRAEQTEGSFILTGPGVFHEGFNSSTNIAEAVNFAIPEWTSFLAKADLCTCMDADKTLYLDPRTILVQTRNLQVKSIDYEFIDGILRDNQTWRAGGDRAFFLALNPSYKPKKKTDIVLPDIKMNLEKIICPNERLNAWLLILNKPYPYITIETLYEKLTIKGHELIIQIGNEEEEEEQQLYRFLMRFTKPVIYKLLVNDLNSCFSKQVEDFRFTLIPVPLINSSKRVPYFSHTTKAKRVVNLKQFSELHFSKMDKVKRVFQLNLQLANEDFMRKKLKTEDLFPHHPTTSSSSSSTISIAKESGIISAVHNDGKILYNQTPLSIDSLLSTKKNNFLSSVQQLEENHDIKFNPKIKPDLSHLNNQLHKGIITAAQQFLVSVSAPVDDPYICFLSVNDYPINHLAQSYQRYNCLALSLEIEKEKNYSLNLVDYNGNLVFQRSYSKTKNSKTVKKEVQQSLDLALFCFRHMRILIWDEDNIFSPDSKILAINEQILDVSKAFPLVKCVFECVKVLSKMHSNLSNLQKTNLNRAKGIMFLYRMLKNTKDIL